MENIALFMLILLVNEMKGLNSIEEPTIVPKINFI